MSALINKKMVKTLGKSEIYGPQRAENKPQSALSRHKFYLNKWALANSFLGFVFESDCFIQDFYEFLRKTMQMCRPIKSWTKLVFQFHIMLSYCPMRKFCSHHQMPFDHASSNPFRPENPISNKIDKIRP